MGRITNKQRTPMVNVEKLVAALYAATDFVKEADDVLSYLGIGIKPKAMGSDLHSSLQELRKRLEEMGE